MTLHSSPSGVKTAVFICFWLHLHLTVPTQQVNGRSGWNSLKKLLEAAEMSELGVSWLWCEPKQ